MRAIPPHMWCLIALVSCSACRDILRFDAPIDSATLSAALAVEHLDDPEFIQVDLLRIDDVKDVDLTFSKASRFTLLQFDQTLETLSLERGRAAERANGRPLPRAFRVDALLTTGEDDREAWSKLEGPSGRILRFRFGEPLDPNECVRFGGCYNPGGRDDCVLPCPAPSPPEPPLDPIEPDRAECLPPWGEIDVAGARPGYRACVPLDLPACPEHEFRFVGSSICTPIGPACTNEWADDLPTGRSILFVRAGASPGGDGSRSAPFGTIEAALEVAVENSIIALSLGEHRIGLTQIDVPVTIWGACARGTFIQPQTKDVTDSLISTTSDLELRRVRIEAAGSIRVFAGTLTVRDAEIVSPSDTALFVDPTGNADLERVAIEGLVDVRGACRSTAAMIKAGPYAVNVQGGSARVDLQRVSITAHERDAIRVLQGASFIAHEIYLADVSSSFAIEEAATATITDAFVYQAERIALAVRSAARANVSRFQVHGGAPALIETEARVTIENLLALSPMNGGIYVRSGSSASLARVLVVGHGSGLHLRDRGTTAVFSDLTIDTGDGGERVGVHDGSVLTGSRLKILGEGSNADLLIHGGRADLDDVDLRGRVQIQRTSDLSGDRWQVRAEAGAALTLDTGSLTLKNVRLDLGPNVSHGLNVHALGSAFVERFAISGGEVGLEVEAGGITALHDGEISGARTALISPSIALRELLDGVWVHDVGELTR